MQRTSSLLEPLFAKLGISEGVRLVRIKSDWDKIFDKPLSLHMWPSKYSGGSLLVNVESPLWLHQLGYHKNALLKKLAPYGVRDIRFRVGKISKTERPAPDVRTAAELSGEDSSFIAGLVSEVGDDQLREAIRGAAEKSLRVLNKKAGK